MTLGKIPVAALIFSLMVLPIVLSVPRATSDNSAASRNINQGSQRITPPLSPFRTLSIVSSPYTATTSTPSTGVIVPLFTYPTSPTWNEVIQAKLANPSVPIIAIINPDSGPGVVQDSNYKQGIDALRSAGVTVLGYVYTQYAQRNLTSAEADISTYHGWYNISGILFDEMSNVVGNENYYSTLSSYAKSLGYVLTAGNAGTSVPASYIGTVNIINIYENQGLPLTSSLASWTGAYSKQNFAMVSYGVSSVNSSYEASASNYVSWIYITDANLPNPYDVLPTYFASEVAALNATTQPPAQTVSLTVQSVDMGGNPISGLWTVIKSASGTVVDTGYTPLTYEATIGSQYTVTVDNYGSYYFNHWSSGSTSNSMTFTPTQATTLTAYYESPNTSTTTSTSSTGTTSTSQQTSSTSTSSQSTTSTVSSTTSSTSSQSTQTIHSTTTSSSPSSTSSSRSSSTSSSSNTSNSITLQNPLSNNTVLVLAVAIVVVIAGAAVVGSRRLRK